MNYGFENEQFYVQYNPCTREVGSFKDECLIRAEELYKENKKIILSVSSGLDSQIALYSFHNRGIPIEHAFMYMEGYNDNEYKNLKILEKKYNFKSNIVKIDPIKSKDECLYLAKELDTNPLHILHYLFLKQLPENYDVIQVAHDPWIVTSSTTKKNYLVHSFYDPEISRYHALNTVRRTGKFKLFGDSDELFLSCINDELFQYFLTSNLYFNTKTTINGKKIDQVSRYDYYIKPLLYAKHWGDNLVYFPKFAGYENIPWLRTELEKSYRFKICFIEWNEGLSILKDINGSSKKYREVSVEEFKLNY